MGHVLSMRAVGNAVLRHERGLTQAVKSQQEGKIPSLTIRGIQSSQSNKQRPVHEKAAEDERQLHAMQIAQRDRLAAASARYVAVPIDLTELCHARWNTLPVSQEPQLMLELVWFPDVIVIQKAEPLAAGMISAEIDGVCLARQRLIKHTEARISWQARAVHPWRVGYHKEFKVAHCLCEHRRDSLGQVSAAGNGRYDDRYEGRRLS
jgi:hypothetical protein